MTAVYIVETLGIVVLSVVMCVLVLLERRSQRKFRDELAECARQRWEIIEAMPAGEARDRLALLHGRIAEITEPVWADLWRRP